MNIQELYKIFKSCNGVATDSRKISGGELFFALKGEKFDGNAYAAAAIEAGAAYAVIDSKSETAAALPAMDRDTASRFIPVEDTLRTLQELARWHRSATFVHGKPLTVIGLTGTNGKTTTKELIKAVLSVRYRVTATEGNLNNSIGVPLSLLKIDGNTEMAVIEMGASHPGDIKELVSVCLPNFGLITNVGKGHLLGFGSFEGVKKAKGELYDYIQRTADKVFLNADDPVLREMASERPDLQTIQYGLRHEGAEILTADPAHPYLRILLKDENLEIDTRLIGSYNAANVMAAMAVGQYFGIPHTDAAKAIEAYTPVNNRSQLVHTGRNTLIIDAYNANPTSMAAALENFASTSAEHKTVMLGDMLELGTESIAEHEKILEQLHRMEVEHAYLVGDEFRKAAEKLGLISGEDVKRDGSLSGTKSASDRCIILFTTSQALADYLSEHPLSDSTVLIKGSRGIRMENVTGVL